MEEPTADKFVGMYVNHHTVDCGDDVPKAAQSGLMTLLMLNARLPELHTSQRQKKWNRVFTTTLEGKALLIVGVGAIGAGIAQHAKNFGMKVIGIRKSGAPQPGVDEMHKADALHSLLPRADFVMLNAALTPETKFIIGKREIAHWAEYGIFTVADFEAEMALEDAKESRKAMMEWGTDDAALIAEMEAEYRAAEAAERCCPVHPDWPTLAQHLLDDFPDATITDIVREVRRYRDAVEGLGLAGEEAVETGEAIARNQLSLLTGRLVDVARLDPERHERTGVAKTA